MSFFQQYNSMSKLLYQTSFISLPSSHIHTLATLSSSHFVTPHDVLLLIVSPTAQSPALGSLANTIQIQILCLIITDTDTPILQAHERTVDSRAAVSGPVCRGWRDDDVYRCRYLEVNGRSAGGSSASPCRIGEGRGGGKPLLPSNRR